MIKLSSDYSYMKAIVIMGDRLVIEVLPYHGKPYRITINLKLEVYK